MNLTRKHRGIIFLLTIWTGIFNACQAQSPLKIGFIYVGPIGDHGWNFQHDQARLAVEKKYAGQVKTTYVENVPESADAQRVLTQLAKSGHELIFATSFGYMNPVAKTARGFSKTRFEHANGYKRGPNLSTYQAKTFEALYAAGFLAARMSKSGKVGYLATFPIPSVIRDINATQLGMQRADPKARLEVIWLNTWYDPVKESDATNLLLDKGIDVVLQHTDSTAPTQVCQKRGAYSIGLSSDMSAYGPDAHLTAVITDWQSYYLKRTREVLDGRWQSGNYWGGIAENTVYLSPLNPVIPEQIKTEVAAIIQGLKDHSIDPFAGPLKDRHGRLRIPAGNTASIEEVGKMDWLVEGVL